MIRTLCWHLSASEMKQMNCQISYILLFLHHFTKLNLKIKQSGSEVIKHFSYSTQLSIKS